ncbi:Uncharacterised protein [Mycobacteroides abscessus subsp. abscessus]|nr:Uncharacterised protein [Mycobacteroides abscessus subsp. abscessus]
MPGESSVADPWGTGELAFGMNGPSWGLPPGCTILNQVPLSLLPSIFPGSSASSPFKADSAGFSDPQAGAVTSTVAATVKPSAQRNIVFAVTFCWAIEASLSSRGRPRPPVHRARGKTSRSS